MNEVIDGFMSLEVAEQSIMIDILINKHREAQFGKPTHPSQTTHVQHPLPFVYCEKAAKRRNELRDKD